MVAFLSNNAEIFSSDDPRVGDHSQLPKQTVQLFGILSMCLPMGAA
jgi:hypothetical protein